MITCIKIRNYENSCIYNYIQHSIAFLNAKIIILNEKKSVSKIESNLKSNVLEKVTIFYSDILIKKNYLCSSFTREGVKNTQMNFSVLNSIGNISYMNRKCNRKQDT